MKDGSYDDSDLMQIAASLTLPEEYIRQRMLDMQAQYGLTGASMARIAGYGKGTFSNILNGKAPVMWRSLVNLSFWFKQPMSYWFPVTDTTDSSLPPVLQLPPAHRSNKVDPLTEKIVHTVSNLPLEQRLQFYKLIIEDQKNLTYLLELFLITAPLGDVERRKVLDTIKKFVTMPTPEPAP